MRILKVLLIVVLLQGCGADEANVDSQQFIDDFGAQQLYFGWGDCNTYVTVTQYSSNYALIENGNIAQALYGIDREVIQDVGIRYSTEQRNFELTKHFDGRIILKYDDHECLKSSSQNAM